MQSLSYDVEDRLIEISDLKYKISTEVLFINPKKTSSYNQISLIGQEFEVLFSISIMEFLVTLN